MAACRNIGSGTLLQRDREPPQFPVYCLLAGNGRSVSPGKSVRWIHYGARHEAGPNWVPFHVWHR